MKTEKLTSVPAWVSFLKDLGGVVIGLVGANQVNKIAPVSVAPYTPVGLLAIGGATTIMSDPGFVRNIGVGVAVYGALKTVAQVGAMAAMPETVKTFITGFVPNLSGIGNPNQPMLLNPGGSSPFIPTQPVNQMNGGSGGISTDVSQMR